MNPAPVVPARSTSSVTARLADTATLSDILKSMESSTTIYNVAGVRLAAVKANIRYPDRLDLVLIEVAEGAAVTGVFTRNAFCAAPVVLAKKHLTQAESRYFLINTGNANAGTGKKGIQDAMECCQAVAEITGVEANTILPFSTGVIGEPLPVTKISAALPNCYASLGVDAWEPAATGILTTDTRPKIASKRLMLGGQVVNLTGIAKGAGMIKPNMATMLAFVFTDALIDRPQLQAQLNQAVQTSFNRITVDGDTSTNDCCMLVATGAGQCRYDTLSSPDQQAFTEELSELFRELATGLIKDAEGATKFVTVLVEEGASNEECLKVAYTIAESPLVKTALFASDPNWGRILAAVGRAGLQDLDLSQVAIFIGSQLIVINGGVAPQYEEAQGQEEMDKKEILIRINLGRGNSSETVWTSDLSHDYIRINAEYRT